MLLKNGEPSVDVWQYVCDVCGGRSLPSNDPNCIYWPPPSAAYAEGNFRTREDSEKPLVLMPGPKPPPVIMECPACRQKAIEARYREPKEWLSRVPLKWAEVPKEALTPEAALVPASTPEPVAHERPQAAIIAKCCECGRKDNYDTPIPLDRKVYCCRCDGMTHHVFYHAL